MDSKDIEIVREASRVFDTYAGMNAPILPEANPVRGNLSALQVALARWQTKNFGSGILVEQTLGVCEEAGELAHAILKNAQGIRGLDNLEQFKAEAGDAIADCVVYLMQVCTGLRIDFGALVYGVAEKVMERDWKKDPKAGGLP